ncbi:ACR156Wp [Eremothecium gossypii ATCC 10895]|uniref:Ribonuclease T2-like n=1 Tax=Eremothecium gossypii (strain ATCC 10895 / CBS 109.51 / FGSC 9923 / NRRL Y-1056) TaxID=284811 RepID=RNY1_EREGS|nr:ACR156Wp [Eremothecium gossypii ATCC 10895]Q75BW5.1 RecName: Full=Ribonuclease T2-like; Short=RNase T2-like; Flags: Precursor [Eremothecium gossypii ATCC 10895]AAS51382.1 ACR156Wp [Eremothecium gossypii ATCC 10895]AEY95673.1 FACR156Wp [Eremothecium gossypii FDAG1]
MAKTASAMLFLYLLLSRCLLSHAFQEFITKFPMPMMYNFPSCSSTIPSTCRNETAIADTCCFEYPGGLILHSQFWNAPYRKRSYRDFGPDDSFTIHGLWNDRCDGSWDQFCRRGSSIRSVVDILSKDSLNRGGLPITGKALLRQMSMYWKGDRGDENLWVHEYNKHGLCLNTLRPECYQRWGSVASAEDQAIYDYFRIAMNLHLKIDAYHALSRQGIKPRCDAPYDAVRMQNALADDFGREVQMQCTGNRLTGVTYYYLLRGGILSENFQPVDPTQSSSCRGKIYWIPKSGC